MISAIPQSPFDTAPKLKEAVHWVRPELVARVKHGEWTNDARSCASPFFSDFKKTATLGTAAPNKKCRWKTHPDHRAKVPASRVNHGTKTGPTQAPSAATGANASDLEKELSEGRTESLTADLEGKTLSLTHLNKAATSMNPACESGMSCSITFEWRHLSCRS